MVGYYSQLWAFEVHLLPMSEVFHGSTAKSWRFLYFSSLLASFLYVSSSIKAMWCRSFELRMETAVVSLDSFWFLNWKIKDVRLCGYLHSKKRRLEGSVKGLKIIWYLYEWLYGNIPFLLVLCHILSSFHKLPSAIDLILSICLAVICSGFEML